MLVNKKGNKETWFSSRLEHLINKEWKMGLHMTPALLQKLSKKLSIRWDDEKVKIKGFTKKFGNIAFVGFKKFEGKSMKAKRRKLFWKKIFWAEDVITRWIKRDTDITVNMPPSAIFEKNDADRLLQEYQIADEFLRDMPVDVEIDKKKRKKKRKFKKNKNEEIKYFDREYDQSDLVKDQIKHVKRYKKWLDQMRRRKRCILHFKNTESNYFITLTDMKYKVMGSYATGRMASSHNKKRKLSPLLVYSIMEKVYMLLKEYNIKHLILLLKSNITRHVYNSLWSLKKNGFIIDYMIFAKPIPHHDGQRKKKERRV